MYAIFGLNLFVWGYNWVPLHILLGAIGPATLSAIRVAGGALFLVCALLAMRKPMGPPKSLAFVAVGLLQVTGMVGISTLALLFGDVSRTAILVFTMPFWTTLLSRLVLHEEIGARRWLALAIALVGLGFVALHAATSPRALAAAGLALLAGVLWAAGAVTAKRFPSGGDVLRNVMWQQLVGAAPLVVIALFAHESLASPSPATLGWLAFSALASGFGWLLWGFSLARLKAPNVALGSLAIPIIAALAAFLQLGERPDGVTLTGLSLLLAALAFATVPLRTKVAYQK